MNSIFLNILIHDFGRILYKLHEAYPHHDTELPKYNIRKSGLAKSVLTG